MNLHVALAPKSSTQLPPVTSTPLLFLLQEVLLKRAADLVEALYGMPHNNQVGRRQPDVPAPPQADRVLGGAGWPGSTAGFLGAHTPVHNHSVWWEKGSPSCFHPHPGYVSRKSHVSVREPEQQDLSQGTATSKSVRGIRW